MLFFYALREACQSLNSHKPKALSMGFGVLWAIFVLILLLASGNGLHDGVSLEFAKYGEKTMICWSGWTEKKSYPIPIEIAEGLSKKFDSIKEVTPILMARNTVRYEANVEPTSVLSVDACYASLANITMQEGRFFSTRDDQTANNLCVLGLKIKERLFGKAPALGKYICVGDIGLQVVGILDELGANMYGEQNHVLVTNSFFKRVFPAKSLYVDSVRLTLLPAANDKMVEQQLRSYFARHLNFDVKDTKAFCVFSITRHANKFHTFFKNIAMFTWIIGICFLITGIVGITNMMIVTIKERTQELAIRRVLGARSVEIVAMILWEVLIVTLVAGIIGFIGGGMLMQLLNKWVVPLLKTYYVAPLTCPIEIIFRGLGLMLFSSCLASILPAIRAIKIKPVEALTDA